MPTPDEPGGPAAESQPPAEYTAAPLPNTAGSLKDTTGPVDVQPSRGRLRLVVAFACVAVALLSAGSWFLVNLSSGAGDDGAAVVPPRPTGSSPRELLPSARLDGTFYYYRAASDGQEQVWVWTVGTQPRLLTHVGEPDDLAWEYYAWHTVTIPPGGDRVAWVPRGADPVVLDPASGQQRALDLDDADFGCLPPVWHPDGQRLLVRAADGGAGWLDVASGRLEPIEVDLSQACAVTVFALDSQTLALAYEDHATRAFVAVTEAGEDLWRIDVDHLRGHTPDDPPATDDPPAEPSWRLVDVADGGRYACVDLQEDVAGGAGGEPALFGNVVVDTRSGAIIADARTGDGACWEVTPQGYLSRVDEADPAQPGERVQQLRLIGYHGEVLAAVEEPSMLYFAELLGYSPA